MKTSFFLAGLMTGIALTLVAAFWLGRPAYYVVVMGGTVAGSFVAIALLKPKAA